MEANRPPTPLLLLRVSAVIFAMGMLAAFVWYSQVNAQTTVPVAVNGGAPLLLTSKSGTITPLPNATAAKSPVRHEIAPVPGLGGMIPGSSKSASFESLGPERWREALGLAPSHYWFFEVRGTPWPTSDSGGNPWKSELMQESALGQQRLLVVPGAAFEDALRPDWARIFLEPEGTLLQARPSAILMMGSKSGAVFPAFQMPLGNWKPKAAATSRLEVNLIREAMKQLWSSKSSISVAKP